MFEMTKHRVRQVAYRWLAFSDDPLYLLFEKMYACDPRPLGSVTPHPGQRGFLLTNFICPDFARYRGREIAFFDSRHVAVYWMPGAVHSGGGYVKPGSYAVTVGGYAVKRPVELRIVKDDANTVIESIALKRGAVRADGGFISFKVIARELQCLARQWLAHVHAQFDSVQDSKQLRDVIAAARALTDHVDLGAQAELLQRRLNARA